MYVIYLKLLRYLGRDLDACIRIVSGLSLFFGGGGPEKEKQPMEEGRREDGVRRVFFFSLFLLGCRFLVVSRLGFSFLFGGFVGRGLK